MLERRRPELPLDVADAWVSDWRASLPASAVRATRLDPVEELVSASVLLRPEEEGFGVDRRLVAFRFTYQRLCEQVLAAELARQIRARGAQDGLPDGEQFLAWARRAAGVPEGIAPFAELAGALVVIARRLVFAGRGAPLGRLLDLEHDATRTRILGAAIRSLGAAWGGSPAGAPAAASVLHAIRDAARVSPARGRRFEESVWNLQKELVGAGQSRAARAIAEARYEVCQAIVAAEPAPNDLRDLSLLLNDLGDLAQADGRDAEARSFFVESLEMVRHLVTLPHEPVAERFLSLALNKLGTCAHSAGHRAAARRLFEESVRVMRRLDAAEPEHPDVMHDLCIALYYVGTMAIEGNRLSDARRSLVDSVELARRLTATVSDRPEYQRDLARSLEGLARLARHERCHTEARGFLQEALEVFRRLSASSPHRVDYREDEAAVLTEMGDVAMSERSRREAHNLFRRSVEITQAVLVSDPHREDLKVEFAARMARLGAVSEYPLERLGWLKKAVDLLRPLREGRPTNQTLDQLWSEVTEALRVERER